MPRLSPRLFHKARASHPLLPLVLQATRDLDAAKRELRWLKEFVNEERPVSKTVPRQQHDLKALCVARSRGKPLQYLLGCAFFGDLEITCKPGVLIPRYETAVYVEHLVQNVPLLSKAEGAQTKLKVLDLCTGTGCIPLLFRHEFSRSSQYQNIQLECVGVDISPQAIGLAIKNRVRLDRETKTSDTAPPKSVHFTLGQVFKGSNTMINGQQIPFALDAVKQIQSNATHACSFDIVIANPPYISPDAFSNTTSRSVRNYEPKLALVPAVREYNSSIDAGDLFYPALQEIACSVHASILLVEIGDEAQARRVASIFMAQQRWKRVEIWRDFPGSGGQTSHLAFSEDRVAVKGEGNMRSVFACVDWVSDQMDD